MSYALYVGDQQIGPRRRARHEVIQDAQKVGAILAEAEFAQCYEIREQRWTGLPLLLVWANALAFCALAWWGVALLLKALISG